MFPGRFVPRHYLLYKAESEMQHEKRLKIKENAVVDSGWILARGQRQPAGTGSRPGEKTGPAG